MIVGARQGGLSISENTDLLGFFTHNSLSSLEFANNGAKNKKTSSEQQFCRQKHLGNERGQRRRASNPNNHPSSRRLISLKKGQKKYLIKCSLSVYVISHLKGLNVGS